MRFRDTMRAGIEELFPKIPMRRPGVADARFVQQRSEGIGMVLFWAFCLFMIIQSTATLVLHHQD